MFYQKKKNIIFGYQFYYVIDIVYIYSWKKKIDKFWHILVMLYVKSRL